MLTGAIVLFHNDERILKQAVKSFLSIPLNKRLYLIDNSKSDALGRLFKSSEVSYIHTGENLGFGKAHNLILDELKGMSSYHLILNPDAYFDKDTIPLLIEYLNRDDKIGIIAPKILYPDGSFQKSIRRFPKPYDFLMRRVPLMNIVFKKLYEKGNYLEKPIDQPTQVDAVSGCCQLFRTSVFTNISGFDTRYFMYMEDLDICRKVHALNYKVVYFPNVYVYHHSAYGSKKKFMLLMVHITSIIKYFIKWNAIKK
ncbi:MAG: glycosyltransferase family 2 protein [Flavobacteriaceae bacterium]